MVKGSKLANSVDLKQGGLTEMDFIIDNWEYFLFGFMIIEKVVKITPVKWDDILIDGIKEIFFKIKKESEK